jgi:hypothetical protein
MEKYRNPQAIEGESICPQSCSVSQLEFLIHIKNEIYVRERPITGECP